jgi:ribosomal protein L37AE/L43A
MKCEKCGKEILPGEKYYTAVGIIQCEECNTKSNGTVSMDFIFDKIKKQTDKEKSEKSL